ncbi:MlaD family protein [Polycladidibacter hongkongensis]|uniref:MlaD family protein n=1 Tax=Polycladidibacter hongkongensis TaxID=1647556 RepID=UPI000830169F|nr:MlaD family protein [Pseudovibrio hongkongensis]
METRANTMVIGGFVLGVVAAMFLFTFWLIGASDGENQRLIKVVFPGAVTGLPKGGQVTFNGIKIGDVSDLTFDPTNPRLVVATVRVDASTPLRKDSEAMLGFTGLTGVAYVAISGGTLASEPLFSEDEDQIPVIYAQRSQFEDIIEGAKDILRKADKTLTTIDNVVQAAGPDVERTIANAAKFSDALAANSDGVDAFMAGITDTARAFTDLSGRIGKLVDRGEKLLAAVPENKLAGIVSNSEEFTAKLVDKAEELDGVFADVQEAAGQVQQFTEGLNSSLQQVDAVIAAVDPNAVEQAVQGAADLGALVSDNKADVAKTLVNASQISTDLAAVSQELADNKQLVSELGTRAKEVMERLSVAAGDAQAVIAAVEPEKVRAIVANVEDVSAAVAGKSTQIAKTVDDVSAAAANVRGITDDLGKRRGEIDQIVENAAQIAANLNGASVRVNGILEEVDGYVKGDGGGLIQEATKAAVAVRKLAEAYAKNAEPISNNLLSFSQKAPAEFASVIAQLNRTLVDIQRAVDNFNRRPNRIIFGGDEVPVYDGARRR